MLALKQSLNLLRPLWTILWKSGAFFILWACVLAIGLVPFGPGLEAWEQSRPLLARLYFDGLGAFTTLPATFSMLRFVDHRSLLTIGLLPGRIGRDLLTGLVIGAAWLLVSLGLAWAAGWATAQPAVVVWPVLLASGVAMALNVFTQQLLLNGYVFQTLRANVNATIAVLVSALLFAGYHAGAFQGAWLPALNVFAAGLLFCLAYQLTRNLWLPMAIHFAWNFLLGPALGLTVSGQSQIDAQRNWHAFI